MVELLVVIAIIAVLAGLLLPVLNKTRESAKKTMAAANIKQIMLALTSYQNTYNTPAYGVDRVASLPGTERHPTLWGGGLLDPESGLSDSDEDGENYDTMMQILSGVDMPATIQGKANKATKAHEMSGAGNPKKIPFLDVPQSFISRGYLDPWGHRYVFVMNRKMYTDGVDFSQWKKADHNALRGFVFVYSLGPNEKDDRGMNAVNSGNPATDDINSWD